MARRTDAVRRRRRGVGDAAPYGRFVYFALAACNVRHSPRTIYTGVRRRPSSHAGRAWKPSPTTCGKYQHAPTVVRSSQAGRAYAKAPPGSGGSGRAFVSVQVQPGLGDYAYAQRVGAGVDGDNGADVGFVYLASAAEAELLEHGPLCGRGTRRPPRSHSVADADFKLLAGGEGLGQVLPRVLEGLVHALGAAAGDAAEEDFALLEGYDRAYAQCRADLSGQAPMRPPCAR